MDNIYITNKFSKKDIKLNESFLLTEDQERTIRNKIARGVASIMQMDVASQEVQSMADDVWNTYVKHPIEGEKRQNDEVWAINTVIDRLIPYVIRKKADDSFFVNKTPRLKNAFENLIQAQRKEQRSKKQLWNNGESLHYWNANKKYNDAVEASKQNKIQGQYHYTAYKVEDFKTPIEGLGMTVTELGNYTGGKNELRCVPLCYTQSQSTYNSYTDSNEYNMYALLRDGWQNEPCEIGEDYPLDSYGLSIIFVIVKPDGDIAYNNVRWNHGPKGYSRSVDNIFSYNELHKIVGSDILGQIGINRVFNFDKSLILTREFEEKIQQDNKWLQQYKNEPCFPNLKIISYKYAYNVFDTENNELLSDKWYDLISHFSEDGIAVVSKNGKDNYIRLDGSLIWDKPEEDWFTQTNYFSGDIAPVSIRGRWNYLKKDGSLLFDTLDINKWFRVAGVFYGDVACVRDAKGQWNLMRKDGTFVIDTTNLDYDIDWIQPISSHYYFIRNTNLKHNIYDTSQMSFISKFWFDAVYYPTWANKEDFADGIMIVVERQEKYNIFNVNYGFLIHDSIENWLDYNDTFDDEYKNIIIKRNEKYNIVNYKTWLVSTDWFDLLYDVGEVDDDNFYHLRGIINNKSANIIVRANDSPKITIDKHLKFDYVHESIKFNGWRIVQCGYNQNYIDSNDHFVLDMWVSQILEDSDGLIVVEKRGKYNILTPQLKLLFDLPVNDWPDYISMRHRNIYVVRKGEKYNIITLNCKELLDKWIDSVSDYGDNKFLLKEKNKQNILYIDENDGQYKLAWDAPSENWFDVIVGPVVDEDKYRFCKGEFWAFQLHNGNQEAKILVVKGNKILGIPTNERLDENILLTEDQERTIRNKIARGVAAITQMDAASQEVQSMTDDIWNTYVKHPIEGEKRQNDEVWAINTVISRLVPYVVRRNVDGSFFVYKNPRIKNSFENLIQAQRKEQQSKRQLWADDESLTYWNTNKKYADALQNWNQQTEAKYHYTVYKVEDYNTPIEGLGMTVTELGKYTGGQGAVPLCYTQSENTYYNYTRNNKCTMYALLRDGWENEPCEIGEGYPLDSYGLSMIFVIVSPNGDIEYSNVRWNHGPKGYSRSVDNIFLLRELADLVGSNIIKQLDLKFEVDKSLKLTLMFEKLIKSGTSIASKFNVDYSNRRPLRIDFDDEYYNFVDSNNNLLSDRWFDFAYRFENGYACVTICNRENFLRTDGSLVWDKPADEWFDEIGQRFVEGAVWVCRDEMFNFLREDGTLVWDTEDTSEWFENANDFEDGLALVGNWNEGEYNFLTLDGELLCDRYYNLIGEFKDGCAMVKLNGKENFIRIDGSLVWDKPFEEWFDWVVEFRNGLAKVRFDEDKKWNFLRTDGTLLYDINYDSIGIFNRKGFASIRLDKYTNVIRRDGSFVWDKPLEEWFGGVHLLDDGEPDLVAFLFKNDARCYLKNDGHLYDGDDTSIRIQENKQSRQILAEEDSRIKGTRNTIINNISYIINKPKTDPTVLQLAQEVWDTYVVKPIAGENRQIDEYIAIRSNIPRLLHYVLKQNIGDDDNMYYYISKNQKFRNSFENLIQKQRQDNKTPILGDTDNNFVFWDTSNKYNEALRAADEHVVSAKSNYSVYKVEDYDTPIEGLNCTVTELGQFTGGQGAVPLCYTQSKSTYDNYTKNNKYDMYALLRDGWQDEPCEIGEDYPLDSYGLSMIFVIIDEAGNIQTNNVRWNHGPNRYSRSVDNILSYEELESVVGTSVLKTISVHTAIDESLRLTYDFEKAVQDNDMRKLNSIECCKYIRELDSYEIIYGDKFNIMDSDNNLLSDIWFDSIYTFEDGYAIVTISEKENLLDLNGNLVVKKPVDEWPECCGHMHCGYAVIRNNSKYNYIGQNGNYLWDKPENEWFDDADSFSQKYKTARVKLDGKFNHIKTDGTFVWNKPINEWFNGMLREVSDGVICVRYDINTENYCKRAYNYLKLDGTLLYNAPKEEWFDMAYQFGEGFGPVEKNYKQNFINVDGKIISKVWFDDTCPFHNGFARVRIIQGNKEYWNFLKPDGNCLFAEPFDAATDFTNGVAVVGRKGRFNYATVDGKFLWNKPDKYWFGAVKDFYFGRGVVYLNKKYNFLLSDGTLLLENWADYILRYPRYDVDLAAIRINHKYNLCDSQRFFIDGPLNTWLDSVQFLREGYITIEKNNKYNFLSTTMELLWDKPEEEWFDDIIAIGYGEANVMLNGKQYVFSFEDFTATRKHFDGMEDDEDMLLESLKDRKHTLFNSIKRNVAQKTSLDVNGEEVANMSQEIWDTYIEPIDGHGTRRQITDRDFLAMRNQIPRLVAYAVVYTKLEDGSLSFRVDKRKRLRDGFQSLISRIDTGDYDNIYRQYSKFMDDDSNMQSDESQDGFASSYTVYKVVGYDMNLQDLEGNEINMTLSEIGKYTGEIGELGEYEDSASPLCYTESEETYNNYTNDGSYNMYIFLRQGWQAEPCEKENGYPYDSYGLSMIFIVVSQQGLLLNSNVRWNHGDGSYPNVDKMFNYSTLSKVVGNNLLNQIKMTNVSSAYGLNLKLEQQLDNGEDLSKVFDNYEEFPENTLRKVFIESLGYNYIDENNNLLFDDWLELAFVFKNGSAIVKYNNGNENSWNLIDTDGEPLLAQNVNHMEEFYDGYSRVWLEENGHLYATYVDYKGHPINNQLYKSGRNFKNGYAVVATYSNHWYYIDTNGKRITNEEYASCSDFYSILDKKLAIVILSTTGDTKLYTIINEQGDKLIKPTGYVDFLPWVRYKQFDLSNEHNIIIARIGKDREHTVFINENFQIVSNSAFYRQVTYYTDNQIFCMIGNNNCCIVDIHGNIMTKEPYFNISPPSEGISNVILTNGNRSFIDAKTCQRLNNKEYLRVFDFVNGYGRFITLEGRYGKIDKNGNEYFE